MNLSKASALKPWVESTAKSQCRRGVARGDRNFPRPDSIEEGMEVDLSREGYLLDNGPKPKTAKRKFGGF